MTIKNHLQQFSKDELIAQIIELSKKYKEVKAYYDFTINPDSNNAKEEAKKMIEKNIDTKVNGLLKLGEARNAIAAFKKLKPTEIDIIDVMLFFVECGINYTNEFGDIHEQFYISIEGMFEDACKKIRKENAENFFKKRCSKMVSDTENIGWGFHDQLTDYYYTYFEQYE